jgi:hypothetical protein
MILADFHLPRRLRPVVARVSRVICDADIDRLALVDHVVDGFELSMRTFPAGVRTSLTLGLGALEVGALARYGRPFSQLDDERARAWFATWWDSRWSAIRQLARALKSLAAMAYYDAAPIRARLEYHPDAWIAERARQRLESYGVDIARAEEIVRAPDPLVPLRRRRHA